MTAEQEKARAISVVNPSYYEGVEKYLTESELNRLRFLEECRKTSAKAINSDSLELQIKDLKIEKEKTGKISNCRLEIVDNIDGASLLHIPIYKYSAPIVYKSGEHPDNLLVAWWRSAEYGYEYENPAFIKPYEPESFLIESPYLYIKMQLGDTTVEEVNATIQKMKKNIIKRACGQSSGIDIESMYIKELAISRLSKEKEKGRKNEKITLIERLKGAKF